MGKKFWKFIIIFWLLLLAVGVSTVIYIKQQQALERKEFIAQFNYDQIEEDLEENEDVVMNEEYPLIVYKETEFLNAVQEVLTKLESFESAINNFSPKQKDKAIPYTLEAYQHTKNLLAQFANISIKDSPLVEEKIYKKISNATYQYIKSSSIFFVIKARSYSHSSQNIQAQLNQAHDTMLAAKKHLHTLLQLSDSVK